MKLNEMNFSVLMSVYYKEHPKYFRQAVESVLNQTIRPKEIVIVKDGKLTDELESVCTNLLNDYPQYIRFIPLEKNVGLGLALQKGVLECKNDLIARMDTDDLSKPDRFEKQLRAFCDNPQLSVCGGYIEEFSKSVMKIENIRCVPLDMESIYEFAKKRNPFNHMTVMFKKKDVLDAGNYQSFYLLEDYYLWFRMIMKKKAMINVSDILVSVRGGKDMILRRGGWKYFREEKKLYEIFYNKKYINGMEYRFILIVRLICRLMPSFIRKTIYGLFLRHK